MASLLERIDLGQQNGGLGPVRNRGGRAGSVPYDRSARLGQSNADQDSVWKHDLYNGPGKDLASRLSDTSPTLPSRGASLALRQAIGQGSRKTSTIVAGNGGAALNIKGASAVGSNVVQVENLAGGTSAADVEAIFKRCGPILESRVHGSKPNSTVTVRLKYKNADDAKRAVAEFNGKTADGHALAISIVGSASTVLSGRLEGGDIVNGTVDVLMDDGSDNPGGSKMRSDELLSDPRAQILTIPPGVDPAEYGVRGNWRGRGRGRVGRGSSRRVRRTGSAMILD